MTETEKIVRIFHESREMRDPERGAAVFVIAVSCVSKTAKLWRAGIFMTRRLSSGSLVS